MVEFQGRFDENVTKSLNNRQFKKLWWAFAAISVLLIILGVAALLTPEDGSDRIYGAVMIGLGILFTPLVIIFTKIVQKNVNKSMHVLSEETIEIYQFYPDKLVITQRKGEEYEAATTTKYSYLYMVEETPDTYFLRVSKLQSHVVKKADLTQGSLDELNSILAANLGDKFKPQKN